MQKKWALVVLFVVAGFLRLWNLGYSDYQGDEIKALYNPKEATSAKFFLEQRKGPMQFLVTAGLKTLTPDYRNRFLVRLPFALSGFGAVVVFYLVAKSLFYEKIAFYATIFFATNGFLIAFSRIVQYQSLVIFFGLLAIYLTKKYVDTGKPRFLIYASVSLALSILSHYDGVFFIPMIFGLLLHKNTNIVLKHLVLPTLLFITLTGAFYIPFALNVAQSTTAYWAGRISGDVSNKISSSRYLFSVYQPIYVLHIYTILGIMGFCLSGLVALYKLFPQVLSKFLAHVYKMEVFKGAHSPFSLSILLSLLAWFLLPFIALEAVISIPGTHIYTYLIPLFLLVGFAIFHMDLMVAKFTLIAKKALFTSSPLFVKLGHFIKLDFIFNSVRPVFTVCVWLLFLFLSLQSYFVFVDHTYEYPWENKQFLIWTLPKPTPIFHLSMFGFPYYRHWDEIGDFIKSDKKALYYTTNERVSIARYHVDLEKDGEKAGYYIYIKNPQTFTNEITNKRVDVWIKTNPPVVQYSNSGRTVSGVYFIL